MKVNLVTKNTVTLTWEAPKNNGGSPVKHYVIERLSWDTSGKEKETWKQCNKREVEELTFVVEDLKEVGPPTCERYNVRLLRGAVWHQPSISKRILIMRDKE